MSENRNTGYCYLVLLGAFFIMLLTIISWLVLWFSLREQLSHKQTTPTIVTNIYTSPYVDALKRISETEAIIKEISQRQEVIRNRVGAIRQELTSIISNIEENNEVETKEDK